jgi:DinB superfamily
MNLTKRTELHRVWAFMLMALGLFAGSMTARAQQTKPTAEPESAPTIASVMEVQLRIVESQFVPAAEAMPEDKYSFAPTNGEYKEVRTFAQQVKHVATANFVFYSAVLGQAPPAGATLAGTTNGPEDIRTKEQILKYLSASFALGHKAFATLTAGNAATPLVKPPISLMNTAGNGELQLRARVRSLWANGGVFADESNCSAGEQGAAAGESGRPISEPWPCRDCQRIIHIR